MKSFERDDAFGQILWNHHTGKPSVEIVEREDGWIGVSEPDTYFKPYDEWRPHEREAMRHAKGRVLDVGCGAGKHAIYLQEKDMDVLGIDVSPLALKTARARGLRKVQLLPVTQVSTELGSFETIIMMGSGFSLLANQKRARWLLKRFYRMTSPDARIIAESTDPYTTTKKCHLDYQKANRRKGKFSLQMTIRIRFEEIVGPWFEYLKVSRDEMQGILEGTGWRVSEFIPETGDTYCGIFDKA
jgi:ubiquinone/menaquinone biosynthesis C-methylase UbiE